MEYFFQAVAAVLLTALLIQVLRNHNKGIGELLSVLVCGMVILTAISYIKPVLDFARSLRNMGSLDSDMMKTVLKVVGVSVTAEIAELICNDSGNSAMGKALQFLATAVIICLSIPMLTSLLNLIEGILGEL